MSADERPGAEIADLGDGLVLRRGRSADADALAAFGALMHGTPEQPAEDVGCWTRDLLSGRHPTTGPRDFTVVEERATGRIVSSLCLISQRWAYAGIPLGVGRPELVATLPEYRRRGLVRRQIEEVHRWSGARGHLLQAITGIPFYYRQFGYEMALAAVTPRTGYRPHIPPLDPGMAEPFRFRPAATADLPFLIDLEARSRRRSLLAALRDETLWRHELAGHSAGSRFARRELYMIERAEDATEGSAGQLAGPGQSPPVGYVAHLPVSGPVVQVTGFELVTGAPGASWLDVTPSVLRFLGRQGEMWERGGAGRHFAGYTFALGDNHPVFQAAPQRFPVAPRPYADYVRVPDLAAFVRHIAPVLEARLAAAAPGYSGTLRLSFYRSGVRLTFAEGRLTQTQPWPHPERREADAAFAGLTFLNLLFGRLSLDELQAVFPDCYARTDQGRVLTGSLFPKQPSHVWYVG